MTSPINLVLEYIMGCISELRILTQAYCILNVTFATDDSDRISIAAYRISSELCQTQFSILFQSIRFDIVLKKIVLKIVFKKIVFYTKIV